MVAGSEPAPSAETGREGTAKHKGHCLPRGPEFRRGTKLGGRMAWKLDGGKAG